MCGFCGMVGDNLKDKETVLTNMMNKIIHRGPDQEGKYIDEKATLGFRRLSIIDVENGMQPLSNKDENLTIVFNGEIYNHLLIKESLKEKHTFKNNSDTESILHGYEEYGTDILSELQGMFAFAIWDKKEETLFAARDFFGIKPFYYTLVDRKLIFASEIKSILEYPGYKKEVNEEALEQYLSFQYSVLPETFFKGIYKLEPGTYLTYKDGKINITRYFDPLLKPDTSLEKDYCEQEVEEVMEKSVKDHLISDVEVASFLSSGVDSSYIANKFGGEKTFTVGFIDKKSKYNEISYAEELASISDFENHNKTITDEEYWDAIPTVMYHMDEPLADASCVALYFLNKMAKEQVKVCLSGEGSDEFFGGYNIYHEPLSLKGYQKIPKGVRKAAAKIATKMPNIKGKNFIIRGSKSVEERFIGNANIFSYNERRSILKDPKCTVTPQQLLKKNYDDVKELDDISKMQYIDLKNWLPGDILLKADKMGMANSIEVRVPFLDRNVFSVAKKLPTKYKVNDENTKITFRAVANKSLPEKTAERKKLGFPTPIRVWLQEDKYYNVVKTAFESEAADKYFKKEEILKLLNDHKEGHKDNSRKIWAIYIFLVWYDVYFK